ncbi:MAG: hypothetical protein M0Z55_02065 [Peptococcaceae bacterium]|nr:hypothetical protein [Peptococcaceae bacterium]
MTKKDALWDFFRATGYIGAYLLYCDVAKPENIEGGVRNGRSDVREVAGI